MGPLAGIKVIEIAGIGPGPFCAMMLADMGADVIRVERPNGGALQGDLLNRSRRSLGLNLKRPEGVAVILDLVEGADVLIEGFRPGVAERLGIGPEACQARNPRLVYGRMTGWGQDGPLAERAGHDMNYIAIAGALHPIGPKGGPPTVPLNLIGDFGGGGMFLAFGVVCALLEARTSGQGQIVDAAMVDGSIALTTMFHSMMAMGMWTPERGSNLLDGAAPFYSVYETKDGEHMAVGPIEPKFYVHLLDGLELSTEDLPAQYDQSQWPALKDRLAQAFLQKTRAEWSEIFEGRDACVYPVLSLREAANHPHNVARENFVEVDGVTQPAPAPRFNRTPTGLPRTAARPGEHTDELLRELGYEDERIAALRAASAIG